MRTSDKAWLTLAAGVITYDALATRDEWLSCAADRYLETHPWLTRAVITVTAAHLCNITPGWADPWNWLGLLILRTKGAHGSR